MDTGKLWTVKKTVYGAHREEYIFMAGRLIMKRWYLNGQLLSSRMFHHYEGLTQFTSEGRKHNATAYENFRPTQDRSD
ncbi:hypothetical protein GCM10011378_26990 [Hymenobacter glacieicola]|uniref:Uncharacterized protein n=1 Tax=Hymenobacter glacieicola TaxID=1562124 RepID=A0ABQ1WXD0_9BACT|nr:hypothetical protein GCM10011378_26990 [Hymenobacter glacieicola]